MTFETEQISLNDGTQIIAPAGINAMTNFVLHEQGDWFEDEIHFVRHFIQPGMNAIDIGANYGLYSTAIANSLEGNGHLWCFEPTANTASALRKTLEINQLNDNVTLIEAGLSDHEGQATFYTSDNAELNSLSKTSATQGDSITIDLKVLDNCQAEFNWPSIDFIKLDAEGEELKILNTAKQTLSEHAPLVMFELKHRDQVNIELIDAFKHQGYDSYYLIPALNILVPFDVSQRIDTHLLNLFACKEETALKLEKQGILIPNADAQASPSSSYDKIFADSQFYNELELKAKPVHSPSLESILNAYAKSRDTSAKNQERYENLLFAFQEMSKNLKTGVSNILELSTYARIAFDLGHRAVGLSILEHIVNTYFVKGTPFEMNSKFIPSCPSFESISLDGKHPKAWLSASILTQLVRKMAHSVYFSRTHALPMIDKLKELDFFASDIAASKALLEQLMASKQG